MTTDTEPLKFLWISNDGCISQEDCSLNVSGHYNM